MQLPGMSDSELDDFLKQGAWVSKLGTHNPDGTIRITPLWYEATDGVIRFNTFEDTDAVRNLRRDPGASLLVDNTEFPYRGVHFIGEAEVDDEASSPEAMAEMFARYLGGYDPALDYANQLVSAGKRVFVRFRPADRVTWDFTKG